MEGAFLDGGRVTQEPRTRLARKSRIEIRIVETPERTGTDTLTEQMESRFKVEERTQQQLSTLQKFVKKGR